MKLAWLFPGQGTQSVGMGRALYAASPAARRVFDLADEALGCSLTHLLFDGPAEALQLTVNAQPAIVAVSLAALAAFTEEWQAAFGQGAAGGREAPPPAFVAGHSVGEYAALVASGAVGAATGLRLVRERARLMQAAGVAQPGGMVAVLGLDRAAIERACRQAREQVAQSYVALANHNAPTQVTIAGDPAGLEVATRLCREAGARRCVPLAVSGAFHSPAMAPAAGPLAAAAGAAGIGEARVPLVANVAARPLVAAADLRRELAAQVASPVRWAESLDFMRGAGVTGFIEFGAGQVLTHLVQRLDPAPPARAVGDPQSAAAAVRWLAEQQP